MAPFVVEAAETVMTCPNCGQRVRAEKTFGGFICPLCHHKLSGGHEHKEGRRMGPQSSDVTRLLTEAARADTFSEQQRLIGEAEEARTQIAAQAARDREVDLARAVVEERLTPVRVHEHHTAATDWLGEIDTAAPADAEREMIAQGSVWYAKLHAAVKAHPDEVAQQALGMAQRLAGRYGAGADAAETAFLDHVGSLYARDQAAGIVSVAASGVPQVGEPGNPEMGLQGPSEPAGLPLEQTSSERAPQIQALDGNTSGGGDYDGWPSPLEMPQQDVDAANGDSGTQRVARRPVTAAAHGTGPHRLLVDDHDPDAAGPGDAGWTHPKGSVVQVIDHYGPDEGGDYWAVVKHPGGPRYRNEVSHIDPSKLEPINERNAMQQHTAACPECSGCQACGGTHRVAVRVTGASGLDQIDQTVDPHDAPKATPYPTDVAFPWEMPADSSQAISETEQQLAQREQLKGANRRQLAERAAHQAAQQAYLRVMSGQDDSGWAGDMGAGGVRPGEQDGGNPGNTFPGNIADADPVYGNGGDNGNQPLRPYGQDEANDYTNNPGINWQPGQPTQYDQGGRANVVGQPTARRRSDADPEIQRALAFVRHRRELLDAQG
jgi:uncharacterized Zn finger protein (UPF0148 family)